MSLYKQFKTDEKLENEGLILDYGDFRVTIARAGGSNKKFAKLLEAKTKPHRRAIQTETMDSERALEIFREVYAQSVILKWETKSNDKWLLGIQDENDKIVNATPENICKVLKDLPDLFADIQEQANKTALFRIESQETDSKN